MKFIICIGCKNAKPKNQYYSEPPKRNGCRSRCKECMRKQNSLWQKRNRIRCAKYSEIWRQNNPEAYKRIALKWRNNNPSYHLQIKFGIPFQEKMRILESQGNKCAGCGSIKHCHARVSGDGGWNVDHDHKTNKVRGILCSPCNLTLGQAKDSKARLIGLIKYLEKNNEYI